MNKQVLVVGISVLLLCVGLSGCIDDNDVQDNRNDDLDKEKFVGTWISEDKNAMYLFGNTVTFYSNGKISTGELSHDGTYEVKDGKVFAYYPEYDNEDIGRIYSFSEGNTKLTLTDTFWEKTAVYIKQQEDKSDNNDDNGDNDNNGDNGDSNDDEIIDYTVPPSIKSLIYDEDMLEVYNLVVETWGYNGAQGEKLADGIVTIPHTYEKGFYLIKGTAKNIGGEEITRIEVELHLFDQYNNKVNYFGGTTTYRDICNGCTIPLNFGQYLWVENFDKPNHIGITITVFD